MSSLIGRIKQNKIGAVVVSVFDWYREFVKYLEDQGAYSYSFALPRQGKKTAAKARSCYSSLWMPEL